MKLLLILTLTLTTNAFAGGATGFSPLPDVQRPDITCDTKSKDDRFQRVHFVFGQDKNANALGEIQLMDMEINHAFFSTPVIKEVLFKARTNGVRLQTTARSSRNVTLAMSLQGLRGIEARLTIANENLSIKAENAFFVTSPRVLNMKLENIEALFVINGEQVPSICQVSGEMMKSLLKPNFSIQDLL